jgi:hypothetical protein
MSDRVACMVYDVAADLLTEIAAAPGVNRFGIALGGDTVDARRADRALLLRDRFTRRRSRP